VGSSPTSGTDFREPPLTPAALPLPSGPLPPGITRDRLLAPLTSWKIGGPAAFFAEPADTAALQACLAFAAEHGLPVFPLGGGTNILVSDAGFPGLVIRCGGRKWTVEAGAHEALLKAGARASLAAVARGTAQSGWAGLEWAEGIPGTIGGAVVGNAGAFGGEIAGAFDGASCYSPGVGERALTRADLGFRYRDSALRHESPGTCFLLEVQFALHAEDPATLGAKLRDFAARRRAHTPAGSSCGSVFKNPPGDYAGRLLEAAGMKGAEAGAAIIAEMHANYIVNRGGATAADILSLVERARSAVRDRFGVNLELEVRLIGFDA
jgi:UDP-N-acetylmuramate dehydrogenase